MKLKTLAIHQFLCVDPPLSVSNNWLVAKLVVLRLLRAVIRFTEVCYKALEITKTVPDIDLLLFTVYQYLE